MQLCPVEEKIPNRMPDMARSTSQSSKTMLGDLPPSSNDTGMNFLAAQRARCLPVSVPPVKDSLSISGWVASKLPTSRPEPGSTESRPAGRPASSATLASSRATSGDQLDGFNNTALPAASAGATFWASDAIGEFHGVIAATRPSGSCTELVW